MIGGVLQIDSTASRASYGILTPTAQREKLADQADAGWLEDIGEIAAEGDRMARAYSKANTIPEIAAEKYISSAPPDVALVFITRPTITYIPSTGNNVDISA